MKQKQREEQLPSNAIGVTAEYRTSKRRARGTVVILGLGAIVAMSFTIIILALIFREAVLPIVFWTTTSAGAIVITSILVIVVVRMRRVIQDSKTNKEIQTLALREKQLKVARLELELPLWNVPKDNWLYDLRTGQRIASPHEPVKDVTYLQLPPETEQLPYLLDVISQADCIMVQGGRGSGKTNVLLHWASLKTQTA